MRQVRSHHLRKLSTAIILLSSLCHASVISVNFNEASTNQKMAPKTQAGVGGFTHWNNTGGKAKGALLNLVDTHGKATKAKLDWTSSSLWGDATADSDASKGIGDAQLRRGYLDDVEGSPIWTVRNIPYPNYSVRIYLAGDSNDGSFRPVIVNGTQHSTSGGKTEYSKQKSWNSSNFIEVTGLSGPLRVSLLNRLGASRSTVAGFQILRDQSTTNPTLIGLGDLSIKLQKHE